MARSINPLIQQSEPIPVHYAGFYSDTATLGQHGWHLALDEGHTDFYDPMNRRALAVLHHRDMDQTLTGELLGVGDLHDRRMRRAYEPYSANAELSPRSLFWHAQATSAPRINLSRPKRTQNVLVAGAGWDKLSWRSTGPMYVEMDQLRELRSLPLFAQLYPDTQELIVEPQDVQQLLDQILSAQGPARKAIRQRELRREREAAAPPRQVHAQIVSLMAA